MSASSSSPQDRTPPRSAGIEVLGRSEVFLDFHERLTRAARIERPVLIVGERGTGKELAAIRLHFLSPRWQGPLVTLNCAALAPALLESELFGHEAGAFTGAAQRRRGRFELADGGTLFLDEIGAMPMALQEKILRAVEYGVFERVGGAHTLTVDARIVGATNADLPALAEAGRFKPDLLDRLSFEVLTLPPLRARGEDIALLAGHFVGRMAVELGLAEPPAIRPTALAQLMAHAWPGNVRELKNCVERAVYRAEGEAIEAFTFDPFASPFRPRYLGAPAGPTTGPATEGDAGPDRVASPEDSRAEEVVADAYVPDGRTPLPAHLEQVERIALRRALTLARYNQRAAASLLGLGYHQFRGLYRKHRAWLDPGQTG